jgi:hypothetical protein
LIVTIVTAVWLVVWLRHRGGHRNESAPHC